MLAAAGIDSTPALVNGGYAYRLPDAPVQAVLDQIILYVPAMNIFVAQRWRPGSCICWTTT
jgi:hypothetical protein